jgi:hypothetical protein
MMKNSTAVMIPRVRSRWHQEMRSADEREVEHADLAVLWDKVSIRKDIGFKEVTRWDSLTTCYPFFIKGCEF